MRKLFILVIILLLSFSLFSQLALPYKKGKKFGFVNTKREWLIPAVYDSVIVEKGSYITCHLAGIAWGKNNYTYGMVSATGQHLLDSGFTSISGGIEDGFFAAQKGKEYILFDLRGKKIKTLPNPENFVEVLHGYLVYKDDNYHYNLLDTALNVRNIKPYDEIIGTAAKNVFIVEQNKLNGLLDAGTKKELLPVTFSDITDLVDEEGIFLATDTTQLQYLVFPSGKIKYKAPDRRYIYLYNGLWSYQYAENEYLIYKNGKKLRDEKYESLGFCYDSLLPAKRYNKLYIITTSGKEISANYPLTDDNYFAAGFQDGLAEICCYAKGSVFINAAGEEVIPRTDVDPLGFKDSCIIFNSTTDKGDKRYGLLNNKGTVVIPAKYEAMERLRTGEKSLFLVKAVNNEFFFVTHKGEELRSAE